MQGIKKVTFKRVVAQNFLSIGEEPVEINFSKGLHLLTGKNIDKPDRANAVGKSAAIESIYFAIFGNTLREIKKDLISNNITGGKTHVELDFDVLSSRGNTTFKVIRTLNPNKMFIYEDGVDKTRDSIANTTKYLCDTISASPAVFQNCVIMSVNNAIPFMAKNKVEKRKFIEDIFGLEVFSEMLSRTRQVYNEIKRNHDMQVASLSEISSNLQNCIAQKNKILETRNGKLELYKERKRENKKELQELKDLISRVRVIETGSIQNRITSLEASLKDCEEKVSSLQEERTEKKTRLLYRTDVYKRIGTSDETCPVCLRSIDEHDQRNIAEEKNKIKQEIESFAADVQSLDTRLTKLKELKVKIKTSIQHKTKEYNAALLSNQEIDNKRERIKQLQAWQADLVEDIEVNSETTTEFDEIIADTERRKQEKENEIGQTNKLLSDLDIVRFILSEEGVKSYIVNKLLDLLNGRLMYYLKKLDVNLLCYFNEYFEEEITNDKNKICSYFNFSGAERKAIDLACLFAFSDMRRLQGGVSYNIAIYDELFDSSFDARGIEIVTDILKERASSLEESAIVVSHRPESVKSIDGDVIFLEKKNGITRRVEFQV